MPKLSDNSVPLELVPLKRRLYLLLELGAGGDDVSFVRAEFKSKVDQLLAQSSRRWYDDL
eukprot:7160031-Pyramimonas_sp.AAC.1